MKITQEVRDFAAQKGLDEQNALAQGMQVESGGIPAQWRSAVCAAES